jgi:hypothetical protein
VPTRQSGRAQAAGAEGEHVAARDVGMGTEGYPFSAKVSSRSATR